MKNSSRPNSPRTRPGTASNEGHYDEEALPLYEEFNSSSQPALPSKDATPAEVRAFLYQILVSGHGVDETSARETANRWKLGGGNELRTYPLSLYASMFGPEGSWVIFRTVSMMLHEEKKPERERKLRNMHIGFGTSIGLLLTLTLVLCLTQTGAWILLSIFTVPFCLLLWYVLGSNQSKTSEELVEWKMQSFKTIEHAANVPVASGTTSDAE